MRVVDVGGIAVVTIWPKEPSAGIAVNRVRDTWEFSLVSGGGAPVGERARVPGVSAGLDPSCDERPAVPMVPLYGGDMTATFRPEDLYPALPRWGPGEGRNITWEQVADVRAELVAVRAANGPGRKAEEGALAYELGALHRDLGYNREAAYYFGLAQASGVAPEVAALQRAGAHLLAHDWEQARTVAKAAASAGAPEAPALAIEAIASLFDVPPRGPAVGIALAAISPEPEHGLIAGALMLRAGCHSLAAAALERGAFAHIDIQVAMASLLVADARLLSGNIGGAEEALNELRAHQVPVAWQGSLAARSRLIAMLREPPTSWPTMIPALSARSRGWGAESAEALFLLGQIGDRLGDEWLALDSYAKLVDRWRPYVRGEPGRRLLAAWRLRTSDLLKGGEDADALAVHGGYWRPTLAAILDDPAPLSALARAYTRLGLHDAALEALTAVAGIEGRRKMDDRATILEIARAYDATGRLVELSDTLDFLAARPPDPKLNAQATLLRGRLHERRGQLDAARVVWLGITSPPEVAREAAYRVALLDAGSGRCGAALDRLPSDPEAESVPAPGILLAARARCLLVIGRIDEGRRTANAAAELLTDPNAVAALRYLAATPPTDSAEDIWAKLARAQRSWEALAGTPSSPAPVSAPAPAPVAADASPGATEAPADKKGSTSGTPGR